MDENETSDADEEMADEADAGEDEAVSVESSEGDSDDVMGTVVK